MLTRAQMTGLFDIGVTAADPRAAVQDALRDTPLQLPDGGRLYALAIGKAARAMMQAALSLLPTPQAALVITNYENADSLDGARVMAAGHPVPDENGLQAGLAVQKMLARTRADDLVLVLVSGGGSALVPAPVPGLSLSDKAQVNDLLLGAGLDIVTMNAVRQHLSRMKGGGLLRMAAPAQVRALILSDVIGDDLRAIASGPTVAPIATRDEVRALLAGSGLWNRLPQAAHDALTRTEDTSPLPEADNRLIGSNRMSLDAMARACENASIVSDALTGDVGDAAAKIVQTVRDGGGPRVALFGGETTVRLRGTGRGGRNQELALRVAAELDGVAGWRFLSGGTDGRDGPTDAAGAMVDGDTLARIRAAGGDPAALLANNDSYHALSLADDLLMTGATGTNVADLQILCIDAP
ncbi:glycerate kinase type-2 family protein [Roseinatronobacter alkalisoli]|uniref:DUF4147 domain-containing protein n=1 Tax=Roseinatronobacter alkalisoli TaxID=3028235 RepID=A0ABT5TBW0_9RHOB|nr:DUF4147 domain-containing protein [Roseinatronobacter sp. HJB301]MDD7972611.1 DUF4147 domain-containing protein [Roseinatronobacter sp. HJB301]